MRDFAVLCVGQGGQSSGMFDLPGAEAAGRAVLDVCSEAAGIDLVFRARADDRLFDNAFAQPALVAASLATWALLEPHLPRPRLFAGYSVGELSAWGCAGAWSPFDCVTVATLRARTMDRETPSGSGMLAVRGLRAAEVGEIAGDLSVAIVNGSDHVVLGGDETALAATSVRLIARGATTRHLDVRVPSHTPILRGASDAFRDGLVDRPPHDVAVPVLRGIDGRPCRLGVEAASALEQAISRTVRWDRCMEQMAEAGVTVLLELGPGRALTRIAGETHDPFDARSVSDFRTVDGVIRWLLDQLDG